MPIFKSESNKALDGRTFLVSPDLYADGGFRVAEKLSNMQWAMMNADMKTCLELGKFLRSKGARVGVQLARDGRIVEMA